MKYSTSRQYSCPCCLRGQCFNSSWLGPWAWKWNCSWQWRRICMTGPSTHVFTVLINDGLEILSFISTQFSATRHRSTLYSQAVYSFLEKYLADHVNGSHFRTCLQSLFLSTFTPEIQTLINSIARQQGRILSRGAQSIPEPIPTLKE